MHYSDEDFLSHVRGLFVGQLDDEELRRFRRLCREGLAYESFTGAAGMLGLGKVAIAPSNDAERASQ